MTLCGRTAELGVVATDQNAKNSGIPRRGGFQLAVPRAIAQRLIVSQLYTFVADEKLIRWEEKRREYLGGAIVLLFGLSSASLAFCGSLLTKDSIKLGGCRTIFFLIAVGFFILALVASLLVHFTRLQDARVTASIIREEKESVVAGYIERLRTGAERWGKWTWWLLYIQFATFAIGAFSLLISLGLIFYTKLFP